MPIRRGKTRQKKFKSESWYQSTTFRRPFQKASLFHTKINTSAFVKTVQPFGIERFFTNGLSHSATHSAAQELFNRIFTAVSDISDDGLMRT